MVQAQKGISGDPVRYMASGNQDLEKRNRLNYQKIEEILLL